jgi:hypothetical protein
MGPNVVNDFAFAADAATKIAARVKVMYDSGTWQDTGLEESVLRLSNKLDTGILDTGQISNSVWNSLRADHTVAASFGKVLADTGHIKDVDTGLSLQIADMDTGLYARIDDMDTGVMSGITRALAKIDTGVGATITGTVDANIVSVNSTTVQGTGDTGTNDPWRPA